MARFIIQTAYTHRVTDRIIGWYDEPNGNFDTLEEAEAGLQSLVDVCGYDADYMRIISLEWER
jgi:hypothetical protein